MPTPYTGDPTATQAPAASPYAMDDLEILLPENGVDAIDQASVAQALKAIADYVSGLNTLERNMLFGDGSDGAATLSGGVTQTTDALMTNLTMNSGAALATAGFINCIRDTLTINHASAAFTAIGVAGAAGSGTSGGAGGGVTAAVAGTIGAHAGTLGGTGATSVATVQTGGSGADGLAPGACGAGGDGGGAIVAPGLGGDGGAVYQDERGWKRPPFRTGYNVELSYLNNATSSLISALAAAIAFQGGSGGGGGASAASTTFGGGGGGQGGGLIVIIARKVVINATGVCDVTGGAGGAGAGAGAGGGGGGGGGACLLIYSELTLNGGATLPTITAAGGARGTDGAGIASASVAGAAGLTSWLTLQVGL